MDWNAFGDWVWSSLQQLSEIAPLGTLLAVIVAYFSYRGTIRQKTSADNRNAWWNRVQWGIDAALSDDEQRRATGMAAIEQMQDSELAKASDQSLLAAMANAVLNETLDLLEVSDEPGFRSDDSSVTYTEDSERGETENG